MSKDLQFAADDISELMRKAKKVLAEEPKGSKKYKSALEFLFKNADQEKAGTSKSGRKQESKIAAKRQREPSPVSDASGSGSDGETETDPDLFEQTTVDKKPAKRVKTKATVAESEEEDGDDDEAVISDAETSQKKFKVVKKKATTAKSVSDKVAEVEKIFFWKAHDKARIPRRATEMSAGFDLSSVDMKPLFPMKSRIIDTGIKALLPPNTYGRIAGRSGLALKHSLYVGGGVIDNDYRGTIKVILTNIGRETFMVHVGQRIAQLVVEKYFSGPGEEIHNFKTDTERGEQGFGSTGLNSDDIGM